MAPPREESVGATPQLTLKLCIIMSNPDMAVNWIQLLAIISAFLSISSLLEYLKL